MIGMTCNAEAMEFDSVVSSSPMALEDDGGWCWFQDERCIVENGVLYVGSVSSGYNKVPKIEQ